MIPFNRGIKRRVSALLCAVVLMFALAGFPVRARAAATAAAAGLTAVGFAVTVAAFLNAAGIYPFSDGSQMPDITFTDWSDNNLSALISQYNATGPDTPLTPQEIKAYLSGATICVTHNAWVALRAFVLWVKDTFALQDNQTVSLTSTDGDGILPIFAYTPTVSEIMRDGYNFSGDACVGVSSDGLRGFFHMSIGMPFFAVCSPSVSSFALYTAYSNYQKVRVWDNVGIATIDGVQYYYVTTATTRTFSRPSDSPFPLFSSLQDGISAVWGSSAVTVLMTLDTTNISVPTALPEGAEFGGLQIADLGAGATAQAVRTVIEDGVMERQQPAIVPVEVQVQQGLEVDAETGAVTENPVVITPDSVALVSSEFVLPTGISAVFPFSIPWDIMRVYQALDADPAFPEIHASLYVPYSSMINPDYVDDKIPFTIGIPEDMKAGFDDFAAKFRAIALLVACIAVTWAMAKFIRW